MAREVLVVPEESLAEVTAVIRAGLAGKPNVSEDTRRNLTRWCDEMEEYLREMAEDDDA